MPTGHTQEALECTSEQRLAGQRPRLSRVTAPAATFWSARSPSDEMRDYRRYLTNVKRPDTLFEFFLGHAHALVLP